MNEIFIYEDIGEGFFTEGITAKTVKSQLNKFNDDEIIIRINSAGGDVFNGLAIYNILKQSKNNITIHIDGLAASAASVIAMAGDDIFMAENALMMIHDPWTLSMGTAKDMRAVADTLDKIKGSIVTTYVNKVDITADVISEMMENETWLNADEAIEQGFATATSESSFVVFDFDKKWIHNEPKPEQIKNDKVTQTAYLIAINKRRLSLID